MDLLLTLRNKISALDEGAYSLGLKAVLVHLETAFRHLERGQTTDDRTAFTDAIYRTNQVFEGSIKESYRVLAGLDPDHKTPFEIEKYLTENAFFRPRVLNQLAVYRKEWRNPSTHDYRLDFDSSEGFLAIISVAAFACLLLDQMTEKIAFNKAQENISDQFTGDEGVASENQADLLGFITQTIVSFCEDERAYPSENHNEAQLIGALHAYIVTRFPLLTVQIQPQLTPANSARVDMAITREKDKVLVEIKRSVKYQYNMSVFDQMINYMEVSNTDNSILFLGPRKKQKMSVIEHTRLGKNQRINTIFPDDYMDFVNVFPINFY